MARYYYAINHDIENFSESSVSNFKGRKGYLVYLTEAEAYSDISASTKIIQSKYNGVEDNVFHLRWHKLYQTLEKMNPFYSSYEKKITDDLMRYMERVGLRDFSGISSPKESLFSAFTLPYPIFYESEKKTYFDQLTELDIKSEKNIFFGGNENE